MAQARWHRRDRRDVGALTHMTVKTRTSELAPVYYWPPLGRQGHLSKLNASHARRTDVGAAAAYH
jgi:hypothetical protein